MTSLQVAERHTLRCHSVASSGFLQLNYVRDLGAIGLGERFGLSAPDVATPSEALLAALGSCLGARIHANAAVGGIAVQSLAIDVEADVAISPMWGTTGDDPGPLGFEQIRVTVHMQADAPREALRALVAHAVLWSPVANTLHDPVHLDVTLGEPGNHLSDNPKG